MQPIFASFHFVCIDALYYCWTKKWYYCFQQENVYTVAVLHVLEKSSIDEIPYNMLPWDQGIELIWLNFACSLKI